MSQVCMLDSDRLSTFLREKLHSSTAVASLLVSATNGSVLAYAYGDHTPKIKEIRTQSTTMATAYKMASEETLVFETQDSGAISVIALVADRLLLAVTGPGQKKTTSVQNGLSPSHEHSVLNGETQHEEQDEQLEAEEDINTEEMRDELESLSQELAFVLREELATVRWPDDI